MKLTCSQFAPDTDEENSMKPAIYIPQLNIKHAEEILKAISEFFIHGSEVSKYAQLFDDDRSLRQHIIAALKGKQ